MSDLRIECTQKELMELQDRIHTLEAELAKAHEFIEKLEGASWQKRQKNSRLRGSVKMLEFKRDHLMKRILRGAGQGYLDGRDKRLKDQCPEASGTDLLIQRLNGIISRLEIEKQGLRKLIEDLCRQYAYEAENPAGLWTGGMSVLEEAFEVLGWQDPHPMPELKCDEPGCGRVATCGFPVPDGKYRRTCGLHFHPQENS